MRKEGLLNASLIAVKYIAPNHRKIKQKGNYQVMKLMKKVFSLVLALLMVFAMSVTAFAAEEKGTITITGVDMNDDGVTPAQTYTIYKLLDLESYDKDKGTYAYKVNDTWDDFFATTEAKKYFSVDADKYATWVGGDDAASVADFAKLALSYAQDSVPPIAPVKSSHNAADEYDSAVFPITGTTGVFSDLEMGYYLVDSTMGALCGLTTTNPNAVIAEKNAKPTIDKQVQEDSTNNWGASNTADIGQIVNYHVLINVHAGAENYVLHDIMSDGLSYKGVSKVTLNDIEVPAVDDNGTPADSSDDVVNYVVVVPSNITTDPTAKLSDGCTFEVQFSKAFCESLKANDKIFVYYSAMLNRNALVSGEGNANEAWLEYGEENTTTHDVTKTYTYEFDLIKTDSQHNLLDGAEFRIYDAKTGGNEVGVVVLSTEEVDDGKGGTTTKVTAYRRARQDEMDNNENVAIVVKDGKVTVKGLDNGTYYLEETKTPEGYNQLSSRLEFTISDGNLNATFENGIYSAGTGVHVVNKNGTMLPETGGFGTTLFYAFGGALFVGAAILLVTKKRMGAQDFV